MLTLAKVTSAEAATSYYEGRDDYYDEGGRAPSSWWGRGADSLGLAGAVASEDFRRLLAGTLPSGDQLHRGGEGPRMAGLDLTFSAPKSLSLQALVGGDNRLFAAHQTAVTAALRYIESELAAYRLTVSGETVSLPSGNLVAARFEHDLSRDADPQVHTHCVLPNLTQRPDGQWRALDVRRLYEQQKLGGALYRAELAMAVQALGYRIRRTHSDGRFELAHVSDVHVDAFSGRRQAIDAALAAHGRDRRSASGREREIAALDTRRTKANDVDRAALMEAWMEKANALKINWTLPLGPSALGDADRQLAAAEAVGYAVDHLTERSAIVSRASVAHVALGYGTGALLLDDVVHEIDHAVTSGELIGSTDGRCVTTRAAQAKEREVLDIELRGRNALQWAIKDARVTRSMLSVGRLTAGQRAAAELILTTRHRVVGVQGLAGTGKTRMLKAVKSNIGLVYKPLGLAPSAAAARELESTGIPAMTIAAFLARGESVNVQTLLVVDEAGMVSARDMHAVLRAVDSAGARVVLVGDSRQLKAVEAGAPFAQMQRAGMQTVHMSEIRRQTNAQLRDAVLDAAEGRVCASVSKLAASIAEVPHATERYERIARHYASLQPADRVDTLVVAGTNRARVSINQMVRRRLGLAGEGVCVTVLDRRDLTRAQARSSLNYLRGDIVEAQRHYESIGLMRGDTARVVSSEPGCITLRRRDGMEVSWSPTAMPHMVVYSEVEREMAVGDRVRFTANDYALGIVNGETALVESVDSTSMTMTVRTAKDLAVTLDLQEGLRLDHGYCTTVHAAQGRTCDRVIVDADVTSAMANESLFYVAISRARNEVTLYTDDREMLPEAMARLDVKHAALDIAHSRGNAFA